MELGLGLWVAWLDASNAASVSINLEKNAIPKGESTIVKVEYHNGKLCPLLTNFVRTDVRRQRKLSRAEWRDTGRSDFEVDTNIEHLMTARRQAANVALRERPWAEERAESLIAGLEGHV